MDLARNLAGWRASWLLPLAGWQAPWHRQTLRLPGHPFKHGCRCPSAPQPCPGRTLAALNTLPTHLFLILN